MSWSIEGYGDGIFKTPPKQITLLDLGLLENIRSQEPYHEKNPIVYVPERTATIVKVPRQSHVALGHYECGGCGATIDAGDRFCRKCGARLEGAIE